MILSMTGYGRGQAIFNGRDITVEIKSVNSRYFEYSSRMPRSFLYIDDKIKKTVNASISRGKIDVSLQVQNITAQDITIAANIELAKGYLSAMRNIAENLGIKDDVGVNSIARFSDIFVTNRLEMDEEQAWQDILAVLKMAIDNFMQMRAAEGEKLKEDILFRLCMVEQTVQTIETNSQDRVAKYTDKLYQRLKTILDDKQISEERILTEAAIFADKTAVDEETVRLYSHIKQYRDILSLEEPVGRKLDFLTQELNREVNTIGSKCQDIAISRLVVDMKSEVEKIREQIQNIE